MSHGPFFYNRKKKGTGGNSGLGVRKRVGRCYPGPPNEPKRTERKLVPADLRWGGGEGPLSKGCLFTYGFGVKRGGRTSLKGDAGLAYEFRDEGRNQTAQ